MNKSERGLVLAAVTAALAVVTHPVMAEEASSAGRYYVAAYGGGNDIGDWPAQVDFGGGVRVAGELGLNSGLAWGLQAGRRFDQALEVEYHRGDFDLRAISLGPLSEAKTGSGKYQALTLNAYLTHAFTVDWSVYAGVGIGYGKVDLPAASFSGGCHCFPAAGQSGLAWLLRLGTEYRLDVQGKHHAFANYSWLGLPGPAAGNAPGVSYDDKTVGIWSMGYRYVF